MPSASWICRRFMARIARMATVVRREPSMVVALLMYAYARANRSARGIERACVEDVAYRVVAGNVMPDHLTIAEFRCRHEQALGEVFSGVLGRCARVGLASAGVVSIDGTKMSANASMNANREFAQIARAILREAAEIDQMSCSV